MASSSSAPDAAPPTAAPAAPTGETTVNLKWISERMTDDEKFGGKFPSLELRMAAVCARLNVKVPEGTLLWDMTDLVWVEDRNFAVDIVDEELEPLCCRDNSNMRVRRSAEKKYESRFLKTGFYRDLRGRMQ